MVKNSIGRRSNLVSFKRTKPGTGAEHHTAAGRRLSVRRLTQFGFGACSSSTFIHIVEPTTPIQLNVFAYGETSSLVKTYTKVEDIPSIPISSVTPMTWIDIEGVHSENIISQIGQRYDIHPLVQSDITTIEQPTKLDVFDDALFLVCKLIYPDIGRTGKTNMEQISFYLKENLLITFQETPKDLFNQIKSRIRDKKGRTIKLKIDYLFYSLLDVIVDQYMEVLDAMGTKVESIDNQVTKKITSETLESIYDMKRYMLSLRSKISPLKEIIIKLQKEDQTQIMQESTNIYLKDLFDHIIQVNDSIDTYREMLASFIDFSMMINSNKMNSVVKTLTIISTIFIPLTFISGVYGMNFENMPELKFKYGYYIVLAVMASLAIFMLSCFKRKKWF